MRTTAFIAVLALLSFLQLALSQPSYTGKMLVFNSLVESFLPTGDGRLYVAFSNGSVALIDFSNQLSKARAVRPTGLDVAGMFYNRSTLVVVDSSGLVIVLNSSTLETIYSIQVPSWRKDEKSVSKSALSQDGRFLALSVKYSAGAITPDRLVIIDMVRRTRIFERDVNSNDVLVYVFTMDFYQNYLVVETIDTACEICQLTDNKIEVYKVTSTGVEKVSEVKTGLTRKAIGAGFIIAQQVKSDGGGHETLSLSLPDLRVLASNKMPAFRSITSLGDRVAAVLGDDGSVVLCNRDLTCSKLLSVPPSRSAVAFSDGYVAVFALSEVSLFSTEPGGTPKVVARLPVEWSVLPFDPTEAKGSGALFAAKYGQAYLYILHPVVLSTVQVRVVDESGKPLSNASVALSAPNSRFEATTNSSGWTTLKVPPGNYTVDVLKVGYSENSFPLVVAQPRISLEVKMLREQPKRSQVTIKVVDEKGEPVPGASVRLEGAENYEFQTTSSGTVVVEALRGSYKLIVQAYRYYPIAMNITVGNPDVEVVNVTLRKVVFNLTLTSASQVPGKIAVSDAYKGVQVQLVDLYPNSSRIIKLEAGTYRLDVVESPRDFLCRLNSTLVEWRERTRGVTVVFFCERTPSRDEAALVKVVDTIGGEVLSNKTLKKLLSLGVVRLYNGGEIDLGSLSREKILVVELFYTQCTGCKYVLRTLGELSRRNDTVVVSLTVSPSDTPEILKRYAIENNVTWYLGVDDVNLAAQANATSFPTILVIRNSTLVFIGTGAREEIEEAKKKYTSLLSAFASSFPELLPETLILTGTLLILLALVLGGRGVETRKSEEMGFDFLSSDVRFIHHSLRSGSSTTLARGF